MGFSEKAGLPEGWEWATLEQVAEVSGGIQKSPKRRPTQNHYPFLRVANVARGSLDLSDVHRVELFKGELERLRLRLGDLLVVEGNGSPDQIGRAAAWRGTIGDCVHQNHLIRVRPTPGLSWRYLELAWNSPAVSDQLLSVAQSSSGLYTLSTGKLKRIRLPIPPMAEQERIVEALDAHLSRLDAAVATAQRARRRLEGLRKMVFLRLVPAEPPGNWRVVTVEEAGTVELGRARHPDWHHGPEMHPYLRVANVFEDRIDATDVMEMDFSGIFEKYKLYHGDVLLNEGQSPHLVGRPALYRGIPENVAFTNSILRFRANEDVLPEWALMVFRRHLHAKRFMREVRITTNIAHLSAKRLKVVEFPIPPLHAQKQLVVKCDELLTGIAAVDTEAERSLRRASALRKALLRKAFSGRLVPQNPDDEPAAALLGRIRAEQAAQPKPKRTRTRKVPATRKPAEASPAPEPTEPPRTTTQQELPL
ncbi:restriction endonuclease subunit S [Streptomyces hirsutus]|uniref:restriction endonuclease subunit S n=1 Tax=Streptomyces hirsutus TaxID=35620 RepID=UPI0036B3E4FE